MFRFLLVFYAFLASDGEITGAKMRKAVEEADINMRKRYASLAAAVDVLGHNFTGSILHPTSRDVDQWPTYSPEWDFERNGFERCVVGRADHYAHALGIQEF